MEKIPLIPSTKNSWLDDVFNSYDLLEPIARVDIWLSIVGFIATVIGFLAAIHAANKAIDIARNTHKKIYIIDNISSVSSMLTNIQQIINTQRLTPWPQHIDNSYRELRQDLISLRETHSQITINETSMINIAIQDISDIENAIYKAYPDGLSDQGKTKAYNVLRKLSDELSSIGTKLKKGAI